jgi:hypothetical protein
MLYQSRIAAIQKAFTEPPQQIDLSIGLAQQECATAPRSTTCGALGLTASDLVLL